MGKSTKCPTCGANTGDGSECMACIRATKKLLKDIRKK